MLAAPCVPDGTAQVRTAFGSDAIGNLNANNYNLGSNAWVLYTRNAGASGSSGAYVLSATTDSVAPGIGYWIKSKSAPVSGGKLIVSGTATPPITGLTGCTSSIGCVALPVTTVAGQNRYNLVGNPFPYSVPWADVRVLVDNTTVYTPTQAQAMGIIANTIWIWSGTSYDTYSDNAPTLGSLQYFSAFWVNVLPGASGHTVKLLIPAQASLSLMTPQETDSVFKTEPVLASTPWYSRLLDWVIPSAAADTSTPQGVWTVRLNVDNPKTGWKDHNTVLGQLLTAKDDYDTADLMEMAPFASPYLTLVFPHPEWGSKAGNYASDLRSASGLPMVWNVDLQADPVGSQVVLTWQGDPAILARSQLTDTLTGKVINPTYSQWANGYPVTMTTSVRHFTWSYLGH